MTLVFPRDEEPQQEAGPRMGGQNKQVSVRTKGCRIFKVSFIFVK